VHILVLYNKLVNILQSSNYKILALPHLNIPVGYFAHELGVQAIGFEIASHINDSAKGKIALSELLRLCYI